MFTVIVFQSMYKYKKKFKDVQKALAYARNFWNSNYRNTDKVVVYDASKRVIQKIAMSQSRFAHYEEAG